MTASEATHTTTQRSVKWSLPREPKSIVLIDFCFKDNLYDFWINMQRIYNIMVIIGGYWSIVNLIGFIMMGVDKKRAVRRAWRIPEASLFGIALIGGALGCTLGMRYFRHKTRHWYFKYGMPAIFFIQVLCGMLLLQNIL